jgi:hypothetical protein
MTAITTPNVTIDQLVGGLDIAAPTMTAMITGANSTDQAALASAIEGILASDPTPGPVVAEELELDTGTKTAAATTGAVTLNKSSGVLTSEALTTAAGNLYTMTLSNSKVAAGDIVLPSVALGDSTQGLPQMVTTTVTDGSVVFIVKNIHATQAFNGTITISYGVLKAGAPS